MVSRSIIDVDNFIINTEINCNSNYTVIKKIRGCLTIAAPTAIPAKPICNELTELEKTWTRSNLKLFINVGLYPNNRKNVVCQLTSLMGVSITLLSPNFFHNPLLTCQDTLCIYMELVDTLGN